jgi:hypothetical protein
MLTGPEVKGSTIGEILVESLHKPGRLAAFLSATARGRHPESLVMSIRRSFMCSALGGFAV